MMRYWIVLIVLGCVVGRTFGIRFIIDGEECLSLKVEYGEIVYYSFVVITVDDSSRYNKEGVDLVVKGPSGEQVHEYRDKINEKSEFVVHHAGVYRFCFSNKSPHHEMIDFDVRANRFSFRDEHAKLEHLKSVYYQIGKVQEALYGIQSEQHYLQAVTDRQSRVNDGMSKRSIHKAFFESAALIGASVLQVFLLRRLFEKKGMSRVQCH